MQFSAILFDLDGTLLDTLEDIADSANRVLADLGLPMHEIDAYRTFVGSGVVTLFKSALPEAHQNDDTIARCREGFRTAYRDHWNVKTRPYNGVCDMLDALGRRNMRMSVLSNKPQEATVRCVDGYFPGVFDVVFGQRDDVPRKPDPAGAVEIAAQMSLSPSQFVYVGDTGVDMQTAVAAGMFPVGVTWGFRGRDEMLDAGAKTLIERPDELLGIAEF